ncbi:MAG: hypothetical protein KHZ58_14640 [Hungatella hathewayi]|nr:hypothetical protein [Hungatella hathewayi]
MKNRLPQIFSGSRICIICEGDEEYEYLERLISLQVWNKNYEFVLENAEGNGNIPARYQDKYQNGFYDLVLVFCDTDKKPYEQYHDIKRKINEIHGTDHAADQVVIFGNPCTMQIMIEHWDEIVLESHKKNKNAPLIYTLTGVENYKGRADQRQALFSRITKENYQEMRKRIKMLPTDDKIKGSSNFGNFVEHFSSDDDGFGKLMMRCTAVYEVRSAGYSG